METEDSGLDPLKFLRKRAEEVLGALREDVFAPEGQKTLRRTWSISEAAELAGRSQQSIRLAEKDGKLPSPGLLENGRRSGYSLDAVNRMRDLFGTRPWRSPQDPPLILSFSNFKGGVGKSSFACHSAQYFAIHGYRVLVVDLDSQASTTTVFGFNPDLQIGHDETIAPYLLGEQHSLHYAIRKTYWPGIDLIPSALHFYSAEYELAAQVAGNVELLETLRAGLEGVADGYDIIILDPPPALGLISISALVAANALVIPVPPANIDFASTTHFFSMVIDTLETLRRHGVEPSYRFVRVALSKLDERKSTQTAIAKLMRTVFGSYLMVSPIKDSAEIDNASARFETVYEQPVALTSREVHRRCIVYLDGFNRELEILVRRTWPSHHEALREAGLM
ncbi:AAA family ATPase [Thiocapsa roseopersicina]|uniref:Chromosome partitioning protein n=1 Tax=Thiocapsa roseopersicina TaxID=1058 RepID=A0A1H3CMT0_THIRO|nr:AAA family ATPase [Thiocapsa roseopersicina]SDX54749.1 chromosome partitioning protein [Thiocapsa roseopersicina]